MKIEIKNFRNVKHFEHEFHKGKINIIFAYNGIGKSSIAKAITCEANDIKKHQSFNQDWGKVDVKKSYVLNTYLFDEDFLDFQILQGNLFENSYDIVFNDDQTILTETKIKELKKEINLFLKSENYITFKNQLDHLLNNVVFNKAKNKLNQTPLIKAINNTPTKISHLGYAFQKLFNKQKEKSSWVSWLTDGEKYTTDSNCPYCSQHLSKSITEDIIRIKSNYNKASLANLKKFDDIKNELNTDIHIKEENIDSLIRGNFSETNLNALKIVINRAKRINVILQNLEKVATNKHVYDLPNIAYNSSDFKKDSTLFDNLKTIINDYNENIKLLKGLRNSLIKKVKRAILNKNTIIKQVLINSGIPYDLTFHVDEEKNTKLILKYNKEVVHNELIKETLSYAEKNIISTLLFSLIKKEKNNIYVYDDPSILFDEHKRFAFIDIITKRKQTKLLTSNDYIIIFTHNLSTLKEFLVINKQRSGNNVLAWILENNEGNCTLKNVKFNDLIKYEENIHEQLSNTNIMLVKLILIRKLIELNHISDPYNKAYNLISSISKYNQATVKDKSRIYSIDENNLTYNELLIIFKQKSIEFDSVTNLLKSLRIKEVLLSYTRSKHYYEKLIIIRFIFNFLKKHNILDKLDLVDNIFLRFITNTFHVENEPLFNLNYSKNIDTPNYIINLCNELIIKIKDIYDLDELSSDDYYIDLNKNFK